MFCARNSKIQGKDGTKLKALRPKFCASKDVWATSLMGLALSVAEL